jgi:hypothetical protein
MEEVTRLRTVTGLYSIPVLWIRITLMRIRIGLITLMRIRIRFFYADPTFHPDADPDLDPDPSLKKGSNPWKSAKIGSYSMRV